MAMSKKKVIRVAESRRAYGVAKTARLLGIHPTQLSYILHGQRKPNETLRRRLARLGVTCTVDGTPLGSALANAKNVEASEMSKSKFLCNEDCNHCAVISNRQVSLLMNTLLHIYGDEIEEIGNAICPNLCCCADCHIDDYCHIGDDDGKSLCVIDKTSLRLARAFKRKFKKEGK